MRRTPVGDGVIVVAIGDRAADHQQQNLTQRVQDTADVTRVFNGAEMIQQGGQTGAAGQRVGSGWHSGHQMRLRIGKPHGIKPETPCQPLSHEFVALAGCERSIAEQ